MIKLSLDVHKLPEKLNPSGSDELLIADSSGGFSEKRIAISDILVVTSGYISVPPATSTSPGLPGSYSGDANYFYNCYAINSWGRIPHQTTGW